MGLSLDAAPGSEPSLGILDWAKSRSGRTCDVFLSLTEATDTSLTSSLMRPGLPCTCFPPHTFYWTRASSVGYASWV